MKIEIQILRCSACNKRFHAMPRTKKAECPHCHEKYYHDGKEWQNETMKELLNGKTDN